jgi:hypothetical protein
MPYAAAPPATKTIEVSGAPPPPWWETLILGVPLWVWLMVGALGVTGVGIAAYTYEEERRRMLMPAMR